MRSLSETQKEPFMAKATRALSPEARSILSSRISRRAVFAGVGAAAGVTALASCGSDSSDAASKVRWANWTLYLDVDEAGTSYPTLQAFEEQYGITAVYTEDINDNDEFFGKVQGQLKLGEDIGYDIITPTDWMAGRFIRLGYTQTIDKANIPNAKNLLPALASPSFDPNRDYSLTYQSIMAGLGWNTQVNPKGMKSLDDLWTPANKGKVIVLSEMRDTIGVILLSQGVDISTVTEDQFMNAVDFLQGKINDGFIRAVKGNEYKEDLISGDATAVIAWAGDLFQLSNENEGKFDFAIPESGGTISSDNLLIPSTATAEGKKNAEILMNYYYDPAVAAEVAAYVNYVTPVAGAQEEMEKIDPVLAKSEYIFPTDVTMARLNIFKALTPAEETTWTEAFQKAAGN
jgi:spermidine/putrescine transport system substrate-binding protein